MKIIDDDEKLGIGQFINYFINKNAPYVITRDMLRENLQISSNEVSKLLTKLYVSKFENNEDFKNEISQSIFSQLNFIILINQFDQTENKIKSYIINSTKVEDYDYEGIIDLNVQAITNQSENNLVVNRLLSSTNRSFDNMISDKNLYKEAKNIKNDSNQNSNNLKCNKLDNTKLTSEDKFSKNKVLDEEEGEYYYDGNVSNKKRKKSISNHDNKQTNSISEINDIKMLDISSLNIQKDKKEGINHKPDKITHEKLETDNTTTTDPNIKFENGKKYVKKFYKVNRPEIKELEDGTFIENNVDFEFEEWEEVVEAKKVVNNNKKITKQGNIKNFFQKK